MLDRREFLKLAGTAGVVGILVVYLTVDTEEEDEVGEYTEEEDEVGEYTDVYDFWTATGNKKTFEAETHLIFVIDDLVSDGSLEYPTLAERNNEINIPNGYSLVSSETHSDYKIRYVYINSVPVEALEYQSEDGEIAYPFAGTPLDLEKAQTAPKVYSKAK